MLRFTSLLVLASIVWSSQAWRRQSLNTNLFQSWANQQSYQYDQMPTAGSLNPKENIVKLLKTRGTSYFHDLIRETGYGVFKINLFEERVILADPVAIRVMYDTYLTEKSNDFGLFRTSDFPLRGYRVSASTTDLREKAIKKRGMMNIVHAAFRQRGYDGFYSIFKKHWTDALKAIKNDQTSVEALIDMATLKTFTEFFLGKAYDLDLKTYLQWFMNGVTVKGNKPQPKPDAQSKALTDKIFDYLDTTPFVKEQLPRLMKSDKRSAETLKSEAIALVFVFAAFGVKSALASTIPLFLNLDQKTREKIQREAAEFNKQGGEKCVFGRLQRLKTIDKFTLEVLRYFPSVTQQHTRARRSFVLDSLQGRYLIKKGQFLTGYPYGAQRNPDTFRFPNEFTTTGNILDTKRNFFAFGGLYYQYPKPTNRKCLGQDLTLSMMKMFVVMYANCDIEPASDIQYTEKFTQRSVASDEPLRVKKFKCQK